MSAKKISQKPKITKTVKKVIKKKASHPKKSQLSISERLHDRNVQAGIVVVLLGFTFLLLLFTYFGYN